jgi:hypothetical protein
MLTARGPFCACSSSSRGYRNVATEPQARCGNQDTIAQALVRPFLVI